MTGKIGPIIWSPSYSITTLQTVSFSVLSAPIFSPSAFHSSLSQNNPFLHLSVSTRFLFLVTCARLSWPRSASTPRPCVVTRTYGTFGDRAFAAAGPGLWNSLTSHLTEVDLSYSGGR